MNFFVYINILLGKLITKNWNILSYLQPPFKVHVFYTLPLQSSIFSLAYFDIGKSLYYGFYKVLKKLIFTICTVFTVTFILIVIVVFLVYLLPYDRINLLGDIFITTVKNVVLWINKNIENFIYTKYIYTFLIIKLVIILVVFSKLRKGNLIRALGTLLVLIAEAYFYEKTKMNFNIDLFKYTFLFIISINTIFTCTIMYSTFKFKGKINKVKISILDKLKLIVNNPKILLITLSLATIAFIFRYYCYNLLLIGTSIYYIDIMMTICFIIFPTICIINFIIWLASMLINLRLYSPVNKFVKSAYNFDITIIMMMATLVYLLKNLCIFFVIPLLVPEIYLIALINTNTPNNMVLMLGDFVYAGSSGNNNQGSTGSPGNNNQGSTGSGGGNGGNGGPNTELILTTTDPENMNCEENTERTPEYSKWGVDYITPYWDPMHNWSFIRYLYWIRHTKENFTRITDADNMCKDMQHYDTGPIRLHDAPYGRYTKGVIEYQTVLGGYASRQWNPVTKVIPSGLTTKVIISTNGNTPIWAYKSLVYKWNDTHIDNITRHCREKYRHYYSDIYNPHIATESILANREFDAICSLGRNRLNQDFSIACKILGSKFKSESGWAVTRIHNQKPEFELSYYFENLNRNVNINLDDTMEMPKRLHTLAVFTRPQQSTSSIIEQMVKMARAHSQNSNCYLVGLKGNEFFAAMHIANWHRDHLIIKPDGFEGVLGIFADPREGVNIMAQEPNQLCPVVKYDISEESGLSAMNMIITYMYASESVPHFRGNHASLNLRQLTHSHAPWAHSHKAFQSNDRLYLDQRGRMYNAAEELFSRRRMLRGAQQILDPTRIERKRPWDL